jgi:hypothetical protein
MCFFIDILDSVDGDYSKGEKVSTRDVLAYKLMLPVACKDGNSNTYRSPYQEVKYILKPGKTFHARTALGLRPFLHPHRLRKLRVEPVGKINDGLHSYRTLDIARSHVTGTKCRIVKFVIPAGTPYFENVFERVSLQLRYVKKIKPY